MATHQVAKFCINSKLSYKRVVRRIGKYLKATSDKGMILSLTEEGVSNDMLIRIFEVGTTLTREMLK